MLAKNEGHKSTYCFTTANGQWLRKSNFLRRIFHPLREAAGIPASVTFHDLRHSFTSLAADEGVDIKVLQEVLGHADPSTLLKTYYHPSRKQHREAAAKMGRLLAPR